MRNIQLDHEAKHFWNKEKLKYSNWKTVWHAKAWEVRKETKSQHTITKCNNCMGKREKYWITIEKKWIINKGKRIVLILGFSVPVKPLEDNGAIFFKSILMGYDLYTTNQYSTNPFRLQHLASLKKHMHALASCQKLRCRIFPSSQRCSLTLYCPSLL